MQWFAPMWNGSTRPRLNPLYVGPCENGNRQLERQLLQLIVSVCRQQVHNGRDSQELVRVSRCETLAGIASCWRSVPASGSLYDPHCSWTHSKPWPKQFHSAGCWAESCHHLWMFSFRIQIFCLLYNLVLEWSCCSWNYSSQHSSHAMYNNQSCRSTR